LQLIDYHVRFSNNLTLLPTLEPSVQIEFRI
jgi:hypothetical protein